RWETLGCTSLRVEPEINKIQKRTHKLSSLSAVISCSVDSTSSIIEFIISTVLLDSSGILPFPRWLLSKQSSTDCCLSIASLM
uniref:Uncharacterized protein n=1 Tax=Ciona savignyi TaxID=51511 RepID=H2ZI36_CIOSA